MSALFHCEYFTKHSLVFILFLVFGQRGTFKTSTMRSLFLTEKKKT